MTLGIVVPTHQAGDQLEECLRPWLGHPLVARVLVVDSGSTDGTVEKARALGVHVQEIAQEEFHHSRVRERARQQLGTELVAYLTQDATLVSEEMVDLLLQPLISGQAAVSYARHLPRPGASKREQIHREYLFGPVSELRSQQDRARYRTRLAYCSNTCAVWRQDVLNEIGGFPEVGFGEDTSAAAALLARGHCVAYVSEAQVLHSHHNTFSSLLRRYFAVGRDRKAVNAALRGVGSPYADLKQGIHYQLHLMQALWHDDKGEWCMAILEACAKGAAYFAGRFLRACARSLWFEI